MIQQEKATILRLLLRSSQEGENDEYPDALNLGLSLPADVRGDLEAMAMFSDAALWAVSESALSPAQQRRLRQLNHAAGERPLTSAESAEQTHLLALYQHSLLRRAHALALLSYRGYNLPQRNDLPDFLESDENGDDMRVVFSGCGLGVQIYASVFIDRIDKRDSIKRLQKNQV